jgi:hypothetical protein
MTRPMSFLLRRGRDLVKRIRAQGLILIYHRVNEAGNDPWRLSITPKNFQAQLQTLRQLGLRVVTAGARSRDRRDGSRDDRAELR